MSIRTLPWSASSSVRRTDVADVDFDLHGLSRVRLIDASPAETAAVARQLGAIRAARAGEPDLTVRFVDRLAPASPLIQLGLEEAGFTDEGFLLMQGKHGARVRVRIPFEQIGDSCEIVCERGLPAVPLLIPILNLTVLSRGSLPLHASAFNYRGTGVLATGWSKGGKTETLLAAMARGAEYVGDEWVYLSPDGRMAGIPEPIRLWDWHMQQLPAITRQLGRDDRFRLRAAMAAFRLAQAGAQGPARRLPPGKFAARALPLLQRQTGLNVDPFQLFGAKCCPMQGRLDCILFVVSRDAPEIVVEPIAPEEVAERMVFSLQYERRPFMDHYLKFRFAFPERANAWVERAEEVQRDLLLRTFAGKPAYVVYHPYPVSLAALFEAVEPFIAREARPERELALAGERGGVACS